uniref:cytochrome c n=1 Tax=Vibrio vulnificus TaxID=672 RepID=UPI0039B6CFD9
LAFGIGAVAAQQNLVNEGQALMKANGRNFGSVLNAMVKGERAYDQAAVEAALAQLDDTAKKLSTLYPASTKGLQPDGNYSLSPKI